MIGAVVFRGGDVLLDQLSLWNCVHSSFKNDFYDRSSIYHSMLEGDELVEVQKLDHIPIHHFVDDLKTFLSYGNNYVLSPNINLHLL